MEKALAIFKHNGKKFGVAAATQAWVEWLGHGFQERVGAKEFESRLDVSGRCGNGFG